MKSITLRFYHKYVANHARKIYCKDTPASQPPAIPLSYENHMIVNYLPYPKQVITHYISRRPPSRRNNNCAPCHPQPPHSLLTLTAVIPASLHSVRIYIPDGTRLRSKVAAASEASDK